MTDTKKTKAQLEAELTDLRRRFDDLDRSRMRIKLAEESLRESEERYRWMVENASDGIWTIDDRGTVTLVNERMAQMLGYDSLELVGRSFFDFLDETDREEARSLLSRHERRISETDDVKLRRRDGSVLWAMMSASSRFDDRGRLESVTVLVTDVTERRRMEEDLRWEKQLIERIMETSPVGITMVDGSGALSFVNRRAAEVLGYSEEEIRSRRFNDPRWRITDYEGGPFPEEDLPFNRVMRTAEPAFGVRHAIEWPDGRRVLLSVNSSPLFDYHNRLEGMVSTVEDVTETVLSERHLVESEIRYRELFENMSDGVAIYEAVDEGDDFVIVGWNRAAERIEDVPRGEVLGRRVKEAFPGVGDFGIFEVFRRVWRTGRPEQFPVGLYRDGRVRGWRANYICKLPSGEVVAIYSDETERMQAVEALRASERELRFRNRIAEVFLTAGNKDMYGRILAVLQEAFVSEAGAFGYVDDKGELRIEAVSEAVGEQCRMEHRDLVFPPDRWMGLWGRALKEGETVFSNDPRPTPEGHVEIRRGLFGPIRHHGKSIGIVALGNRGEPYTEADVELLSALCDSIAPVLYGRLESRRQEERSQRLEAQIQHAQKLESLGVLAGGIAHDFNNLLMGILGNASLALLDLPPESPARSSVQQIEQVAVRAADLTRQMLAYSGKGRFVIEPINLNVLLEEMVHLLQISISKKVVLKLNLADNLPAIMADASQVRQVAMNLVINASEAVGDRSGVVTITTGVMEVDRDYLSSTYLDDQLPEGHYTYLEVSDTGSGMDEATRARIFDPFFTTKFTGRGLGLAAVLGIVRGHRGAVKIYSELGKGSSFKVLFPASDRPVQTEGEKESQAFTDLADRLLLVVDDEETVRNVAKMTLERYGCRVLTADDGRQAVEVFRERGDEIDAVLLDMTMPHLNGEETFRELRRIRPSVRVILSSGYNEQDATNRFAGKGLAGFIQKPYKPRQLMEKVAEILGRAQK